MQDKVTGLGGAKGRGTAFSEVRLIIARMESEVSLIFLSFFLAGRWMVEHCLHSSRRKAQFCQCRLRAPESVFRPPVRLSQTLTFDVLHSHGQAEEPSHLLGELGLQTQPQPCRYIHHRGLHSGQERRRVRPDGQARGPAVCGRG